RHSKQRFPWLHKTLTLIKGTQ
ncbi:hypothetical protein CEXT_624251, partial [Caerostris extrusa]